MENTMRSNEVFMGELEKCCLRDEKSARTCVCVAIAQVSYHHTYIEDIHTTLIDEEALEETLDDHKSFSQDQNDGIDPSAPSVEDGQEGVLRQKSKSEEDKIDEERNE